MICAGIKTDDDIYFLADALFSEETIMKYHLFFIYDVEKYLKTLDFLETLNGKKYIPSHCGATNDISNLIKMNRDKINEIEETIINICSEDITFEEILKKIFDKYNLIMNNNQYVLIGSTIKSYLSYLKDIGKLEVSFKDNYMYWKSI